EIEKDFWGTLQKYTERFAPVLRLLPEFAHLPEPGEATCQGCGRQVKTADAVRFSGNAYCYDCAKMYAAKMSAVRITPPAQSPQAGRIVSGSETPEELSLSAPDAQPVPERYMQADYIAELQEAVR